MGCCDTICGWFRQAWAAIRLVVANITVEPVYFLFCVGTGLYMIVSGQLYIEKVCLVNLDYGHEVCDNLTADENEDAQNEVQKYVSKLKIYSRILEAVPSVTFTLFAGPWSDRHGRKFLLMSSVFGTLISTAVYIINVRWYYELKAEYLLFEALKDCTGGFACFFMAAHAYIADVTDHTTRTKRMAFLSGLWPIGSNIGKALSGVIKTNLGFMYNFGFGFLTSAITLLYIVVFMKESTVLRDERIKKEKEEKGEVDENGEGETQEQKAVQATFKEKLVHFFDLRNLRDGFRALTMVRKHNIRTYLFLLIVCFEMEQFINVGDWDYAYLYLRKKLDFDLNDFTMYTTIMGVVGITTQYITIPLMSQKFGVRDSVITIIDISGCFIQTLLLACVKYTWMIYLGMCIAFLDMSSYAMIR